MDASTEQLISTIAAAIAAAAALASLFLAWRALVESGKVVTQLQGLATAAKAETAAEQQTTAALHTILVESQAARDFELLRLIARHIPELADEARKLRERDQQTVPWHDFNASQALFKALLATLPQKGLEKCHALADADPRRLDPADAEYEVRAAIAAARERLTELTTASRAQVEALAATRP